MVNATVAVIVVNLLLFPPTVTVQTATGTYEFRFVYMIVCKSVISQKLSQLTYGMFTVYVMPASLTYNLL